jgi:NAD(P)-dependent dehydrogenase (short-subunit alcohol dehydrogenase family)
MNIIITGASNGIGSDIARILALNPENRIVGIARSDAKLKMLSDEINQNGDAENFFALPFDLGLSDIAERLVPKILTFMPTIDILINNAGLLINKPFEQMTDVDFDDLFKVNVKAPFRLISSLLPFFNRNAHIVNVSSMGGLQGSTKFAGLSLYSASKGALAVLSECMAQEFFDRSISVNALALGAVQTEMLKQAFPGYTAPLKSAEMAKFIADFALTGHKYFNGKILPVSVSTP